LCKQPRGGMVGCMNKYLLVAMVGISITAIAPAQVVVRHIGAWNTANVTYTESPPVAIVTDWNDGATPQFGSLSLPGYEAWSVSNFGVQRTYQSLVPTADGLFTGATIAAFNDRLVVSRPGYAGRRGFGIASYSVTGSYGFIGAPDFANIEITSRLVTIAGTPTATVDYFKRNSNGTGVGVDFLGTTQLALVSFVFGVPFDLELDVQSNMAVNTFTGGRGGAFVDLSHTVFWEGISDVYLADDLGNPLGDLITDWALSSDSGTNYAGSLAITAVPEPSTYGAMSVLVLILGAKLRQRRISK